MFALCKRTRRHKTKVKQSSSASHWITYTLTKPILGLIIFVEYKSVVCIWWFLNDLFPAASNTSVADIALRALMRTAAEESVCPAPHHVKTAGAAHTAWPASLVTSSPVSLAKTISFPLLLPQRLWRPLLKEHDLSVCQCIFLVVNSCLKQMTILQRWQSSFGLQIMFVSANL